MPPTILVALAGGLGAAARYRIAVAVGSRSFPWATLGINVVGCFLIAVLLAGPAPARWGTTTTAALGVGLLGGFTTFSTFGYETFSLLRDERVGAALGYAAASLVLGMLAVAAGYSLGRALR